MGNNGLDIGLSEFKRMKSIDRDLIMYNNLTHIRSKIDNYKFHKKVQYVWLLVLTIGFGLKRFLGV